jgi:hypothetical protein
MMTHKPRSRYRDEDEYEYYNEQPRSRTRQTGLSKFVNSLSLDWLLSIGSIGIIIQACADTSIASVIFGIAWVVACGLVIFQSNKKAAGFNSNYQKLLRNYGKTGLLGLVFGTSVFTSLFLTFAQPSHAVFLSTAEAKIQAVFNGTSNAAQINTFITFATNGLRTILLFTIIQSIVKAVQGREESEQVRTQVTTIVIVILGVAVVDIGTVLVFG